VACRKIVLAAVVSLFASTNKIIVAAYPTPTTAGIFPKPRRAAGSMRSTAIAATAERNDATCQPVRCVALIAAPPLENKIAAAKIARRARIG
jgi:hypothetical protein